MNNVICILEDCEDLTEILKLLLEEHYQAARAGTIAEFNNMLPGLKPALFLIDVILPDGIGLSVCQHIKTDPPTAHIPVLIMSANFRVEDMQQWTYADDWIAKPFGIDDLQHRITKLTKPKDN